jgi:hypothetical protein
MLLAFTVFLNAFPVSRMSEELRGEKGELWLSVLVGKGSSHASREVAEFL